MPRPCDLDLWPFDLESGVRVTCDVGYLCANFSLPRPFCSRLRPDVRDRQTDTQTSDKRQSISLHNAPPKGRGITSVQFINSPGCMALRTVEQHTRHCACYSLHIIVEWSLTIFSFIFSTKNASCLTAISHFREQSYLASFNERHPRYFSTRWSCIAQGSLAVMLFSLYSEQNGNLTFPKYLRLNNISTSKF